jgi:tetratricopeptide (TPR) repeat protein
VSFLYIVAAVYFPFFKFRKTATKEFNKSLDLCIRKTEALLVADPKRAFLESWPLYRKVTDFDLTTVEDGVARFSKASAPFSWIGLSFRLSRKILHFVEDKVNVNDLRSVYAYETSHIMHTFLSGDWDIAKGYDEPLVNRTLSTGEAYLQAAVYVVFQGYLNLERGGLVDGQRMAERLYEIADVYEHDHAKASYYGLNVKLLLKQGRFHDALDTAEEGIRFTNGVGLTAFSCCMYALKCRVQIMTGDLGGAAESLSCARQNLSEARAAPFWFVAFLISQFMMDLYRLEESIQASKTSETSKQKRRVLKTGRKMVRKSRKVAGDRTEALRLMGNYYWLIGKQKKAHKWWNKSIKEGERLGARLELSRTYMEVGERLLDPKSKCTELNGLSAMDYLNKAKAMFQDMGLQWDLDELERISAAN